MIYEGFKMFIIIIIIVLQFFLLLTTLIRRTYSEMLLLFHIIIKINLKESGLIKVPTIQFVVQRPLPHKAKMLYYSTRPAPCSLLQFWVVFVMTEKQSALRRVQNPIVRVLGSALLQGESGRIIPHGTPCRRRQSLRLQPALS